MDLGVCSFKEIAVFQKLSCVVVGVQMASLLPEFTSYYDILWHV